MRIPTLEGVLIAERAVALAVPPTPLLAFETQGRAVYAKAESLQPMGAFKLRGAWHRLNALDEHERGRGVVAFLSGNHAQGVAWAANRLGMSATIVMPSDAPAAKLAGTRSGCGNHPLRPLYRKPRTDRCRSRRPPWCDARTQLR